MSYSHCKKVTKAAGERRDCGRQECEQGARMMTRVSRGRGRGAWTGRGWRETQGAATLHTLNDRPLLFIETRDTQPTTYVGGRGVCGLTVKPHTLRKQKGELTRATPPGNVRKERKSRQRASGKAWLARRSQPGVQGWASKQNCAC